MRKPYNTKAGYIASRRNLINNGWVVIYLAKNQGLDDTSGKYAVVCETHNTILQTTSLPKARPLLKYPDFCEECVSTGLTMKAKQSEPNTPKLPENEMRDDRYQTDFERALFEGVRENCCCGREYCYPEDDYEKTNKLLKIVNRFVSQELQKAEERDWEMMLSKIELDIIEDYITESLDTSDQSKWGEDYKTLNKIKTSVHNSAIRTVLQAYTSKLLKSLKKGTK